MRVKALLYLGLLLAVLATTWTLPGAEPVLARGSWRHPTELKVMGYGVLQAGGPASLRIISYDPAGMTGVPRVPVTVTLQRGDHETTLLAGHTNASGTMDAQFQIPADAAGSAILHVRGGGADLTAPVTVRQEQRLYLTTDKPLYQPGQTVHVRLLALHEPDLVPAHGKNVTLEIEDAKGNKVFKKAAATSKFGVLSATFDLAREVNMGEYHVKAYLEQATASRSFTVKRYVLPKFKVVVHSDKAFYLPSETMHGRVQATYFFGKPVAGARVSIDFSTFDVSARELGHLQGTTGADGRFSFDYTLPGWFAGRPLDKGGAPLSVLASVVDTASHKEEGPLALTVVKSPIQAELFPESGHVEPGLSNRIYVLTTYPDGSPAPCQVGLTLPDQQVAVQTDAHGFASFDTRAVAISNAERGRPPVYPYGYTPPPNPYPVHLVARDARGNVAALTQDLGAEHGAEHVILRPERVLYRVGDAFDAQIFSTRKTGSVYVDFVRSGQTILTRSVALRNGRATLHTDLGPDTYGAITVHAYQIQSSQDIVRDTHEIFVQPARDLTVDVKLDQGTYRPGQNAKLTFMVHDKADHPRLAVLGVDIVDESLFALAERDPGLERVYFLLEREL
ncbi:MAG: MG2 domain-containing protein, partial [Candidatus Xenobia bacterium]